MAGGEGGDGAVERAREVDESDDAAGTAVFGCRILDRAFPPPPSSLSGFRRLRLFWGVGAAVLELAGNDLESLWRRSREA